MRDRSNEMADGISEIARDAMETKLLKNSVFFVGNVLKYNTDSKSVLVQYPDGTIRPVTVGNDENFSQHVKDGRKVMVTNAAFPGPTYDRTIAILYNEPVDGKLEATAEEVQLQKNMALARGRYVDDHEVAETAIREQIEANDADTRRQQSRAGARGAPSQEDIQRIRLANE